MSHDRSIQVIQYRTFLQPQGLDHRQRPLHELAARHTVTTEGVLPPQNAHTQDAFGMVVCGLDSLDRREQPQRRVQSQDVRAKGRRLGICGTSDPAPKRLGVRAPSGPPGLAGPVGPVRRRGTPTSQRTGIPRPPDPLGLLLQRVLLDRPASEPMVRSSPQEVLEIRARPFRTNPVVDPKVREGVSALRSTATTGRMAARYSPPHSR